MSAIRQAIISKALSQVGVKESPPNSNLQPYGIWYGLNGVAWCAIFVSWVFAQAGYSLGHVDTDKGFHYVPSGFNFWRYWNRITPDPQPGDIVIYDWQKGSPGETAQEALADHTGIFHQWVDKSKGIFTAIEGNTSIGNDSDGGQVMERQRTTQFVVAFVNPLHIAA